MQCKNENRCNGTVNMNRMALVHVGCAAKTLVFACPICNRLHFESGNPVFNHQDHRAFLENGCVVNRDENGVEQSRF